MDVSAQRQQVNPFLMILFYSNRKQVNKCRFTLEKKPFIIQFLIQKLFPVAHLQPQKAHSRKTQLCCSESPTPISPCKENATQLYIYKPHFILGQIHLYNTFFPCYEIPATCGFPRLCASASSSFQQLSTVIRHSPSPPTPPPHLFFLSCPENPPPYFPPSNWLFVIFPSQSGNQVKFLYSFQIQLKIVFHQLRTWLHQVEKRI